MEGNQLQPSSSVIWLHFKKNKEEETAKCNYCSQLLKTPTGTTSTLARHLKSAHPKQCLMFEKQKNEVGNIKLATAQKKNPSNQLQLHSFMQKKAKLSADHPKTKLLNKKIATLVCGNFLPYSFVDSMAFRDLMNEVIPEYQVPSRTTLTRSIIPEMVQKATDSISLELEAARQDAQSWSLTTDLWTSRSLDSYISMTCHYMTNNFILEKHTLATSYFPGSHTGEAIYHKLSDIMDKWNIQHGEQTVPVYVVSDNARNLSAAIALSPWNHVLCFAHSLQLAVNDAKNSVDGMKNVCSKGRTIVGYYHRSIQVGLFMVINGFNFIFL